MGAGQFDDRGSRHVYSKYSVGGHRMPHHDRLGRPRGPRPPLPRSPPQRRSRTRNTRPSSAVTGPAWKPCAMPYSPERGTTWQNQQFFGTDSYRPTTCSPSSRFWVNQNPADSDSFSFLRVIIGLGVTDSRVRESMFNLEVMQRYLRNPNLQEAVPDPDSSVSNGSSGIGHGNAGGRS